MRKLTMFLVFAVMTITAAFAQDPNAPLQLDPSVRTGKLSNGLTYYIKHNEMPKNSADFYIVSHVGALQENPAQDGIAHFLEHMAFNGLKSLPGKQMFTYLEGLGAEFGRNINAATGIEYTTYMLNNIPLRSEGVLDTCLLILHDWSCAIECLDSEINDERQVIIEEKRTTNTAQRRMMFKRYDYILGEDSKFANTSLIGSLENLENFDPQVLRDFYATWYRPDLQAMVIIGDVDVDQVEQKLKDKFSSIPMPENPQPKEVYEMPTNVEPIVGIITDPEATSTQVELIYKMQPLPKEYNSLGVAYLNDIMVTLISSMMSERLSDISMQPDAPFNAGGAFLTPYSEYLDAYTFIAMCNEGEALPAFDALVKEMERAKRFGFTDAELERAKTKVTRMLESEVASASTKHHKDYFDQFVEHFRNNKAYMDPQYALDVANVYMSMIQVQMLNQALPSIWGDQNQVFLVSAPEKEGLVNPTKEQMIETYNNAKAAELEAPTQTEVKTDLMAGVKVKKGKIKKQYEGQFGSTVYELSNGITVYYKYTENSKDNFSMDLTQDGGINNLPEESLISFDKNIVDIYGGFCGLSDFTQNEITKALNGKRAYAQTYFNTITHGVVAGGSPKDAETIMQLVYLTYMKPRFVEEEFNMGLDRLKAMFPNYEAQTDYIHQGKMMDILYGGNPRFSRMLSSADLEKVDFKELERCYRMMMNNLNGSKLYIVGDIAPEVLEPLLTKYIASLPKGKPMERVFLDKGMPDQETVEMFRTPMEAPKTTAVMIWLNSREYSPRKAILAKMLNYAMDLTYTKTVREEAGGTYGVGSSVMLSYDVKQDNAMIYVQFDTKEDKVAELIPLVKAGLNGIAENGISDEYMSKIQENFAKVYAESQISNGYWAGQLEKYYGYGIDGYTGYMELVKSLTSQDIADFAKEMLDGSVYVELVMNPEVK